MLDSTLHRRPAIHSSTQNDKLVQAPLAHDLARKHSHAISAQAMIALFVAASCAILLWLSIGDHALYPPDEGRYAVVAQHMVEGGSWLLPEFECHIHLTKPPLEYWAIAVSLKIFGVDELPARLPSVFAGAFTILVLLGFSWKIGGPRVAALSIGTLSLMPLFIIMSRLATTDAQLNLWWLSALACGYMTVEHPRRFWPWLMWLAVAMGLLTKGPLALAPVGIILLWLVLARRWSDVRRLHLIAGFLLAIIPLVIWMVLVVTQHSEAISIWRYEMVDRATGSGKHAAPWWYYIPIFLGGLFPATAMMMLPWWNASPKCVRAEMRSGSVVSLLVLAVVVPLVGFSLMSGKLGSYLLPLCGPMAILNGLMLEQWLLGSRGRTAGGLRLPDVRITLAICLLIIFLFCIAAALWFTPLLAGYLVPMGMLVVASLWLWQLWNRQPEFRSVGLAIVWGVWIFNWWMFFEMEDKLAEHRNPQRLVERIRDITGSQHPTILTYGFTDPTLSFYNNSGAQRLRAGKAGEKFIDQSGEDGVILVDDDVWDDFAADFPQRIAQFETVGTWQRNLMEEAMIMRRVPARLEQITETTELPGLPAQ